jgi:hypothetical protein
MLCENCSDVCHRLILDGDREELRAIRDELSRLRVTADFDRIKENVPNRSIACSPPFPQCEGQKNTTRSVLVPSATVEIDRLQREKTGLLETGVYEEHHPILEEISKRIAGLEAALRQVSAGSVL